ncbi:MAG: biotin synthase BioB [Nitrosopumilus sp.]|nr:biotin synthase BioB [Nitrosopumilus sp.]
MIKGESNFIQEKMDQVLSGNEINIEDALKLINSGAILTLSECANKITRNFNGDFIDVEKLVNAKSGRCPEDCSFCAQSTFYNTNINKYPLLPPQEILLQAEKAKEEGANSFCIVCAYRSPPEKEFEQICETIKLIRKKIDIEINTSLGFLTNEMADTLKKLGVKRYNHNLETSESFFYKICTTHTYQDRINTAKIVKKAGLELCSGGIIGMGETVKQRIELGFALQSLDPDEVPINILIGRDGTPLFGSQPINSEEIIRTIATFRFIMPKPILKIAGGREMHLQKDDKVVLKAGANGIITGGYLTTRGNTAQDDLKMIKEIGLKSR